MRAGRRSAVVAGVATGAERDILTPPRPPEVLGGLVPTGSRSPMTAPSRAPLAALGRRLAVAGAALALALALVAGADRLLPEMAAPAGGVTSPAVLGFAALYAALLAVPFVPGVEVGLALLAVHGAAAAPLVWGATVAGLMGAYAVGRLVPPRALAAGLGRLKLRRAEALALALAPLTREERLAHLASAAPARLVPWLLRHRHLALLALLNLPGNAALGGGGGIALAAGLSGLFGPLGFLAAVALGTLPVPLAALLLA